MSTELKEDDLLAIQYQTLMSIKNVDNENVTFLVLKTPNSNEIKKRA